VTPGRRRSAGRQQRRVSGRRRRHRRRCHRRRVRLRRAPQLRLVRRSARPAGSGGSTLPTGSAGVTGTARPNRCTGVIRSAGVVPLALLPATSMQRPRRRYHLDRVIVAAVPVRVRTPSRVPNVARAPLREWPRLSPGLVGSAQSDQSQGCGHHGRCCCKTCVLFHIALLPRQAVHQDHRSREKTVRSASDGSESSRRTTKLVTQRTFSLPLSTRHWLFSLAHHGNSLQPTPQTDITFSAYSYLPSRYHRRWR
jgi:hypothetical protein